MVSSFQSTYVSILVVCVYLKEKFHTQIEYTVYVYIKYQIKTKEICVLFKNVYKSFSTFF